MESYLGLSSVFIFSGIICLCALAIVGAMVVIRARKTAKTAKTAKPQVKCTVCGEVVDEEWVKAYPLSDAKCGRCRSKEEEPLNPPEPEEEVDRAIKTVRYFAMGLYPAGCKFYRENGELSMGGELLAAIIAEKQIKEGGTISPCDGCSFLPGCEKEGRFNLRRDRLNTDGLEPRTPTDGEMRDSVAVMILPFNDTVDWIFDLDKEIYTNAELGEVDIPWVARMIRKRITGENLKIEITEKAYHLLSVLTDGDPGNAMFALHKIGNLFEKRGSQRWLVNSWIVAGSLFPRGFPSEESFGKWWDGQKVPRGSERPWSDNMVDIFPDEWRRGKKASKVAP